MQIFVWMRRSVLVSTALLAAPSVLYAQESLCPDWADGESAYRFPVQVSDDGGVELQDFSALVILDTTAAVADGSLEADGSDLRFYDSNDAQVPHWIEEGVGTAQTRVWVRLPSIPASGDVQLFAYHGGAEVQNRSDIHAAFLAGEDFDQAAVGSTPKEPWEIHAGNVLVLFDGSNRALKPLGAGTPGFLSYGNEARDSYTVMATVKDADSGTDEPQMGLIFAFQDDQNFDSVFIREAADELVWGQLRAGVWSVVETTDIPFESAQRYDLQARVDGSGPVEILIDGTPVMSIVGSLAGTGAETGLLYHAESTSAVGYWDNFRIRAYADTEPGSSFGSTEVRDCDEDGFIFGEDCDDEHADAHIGGIEVCGDGIDQDCSGADLSCDDVDNDIDGYTENQGDCNDGQGGVHPGATEVCGDSIDQDCASGDLSCDDVDDDGDGFTENEGDCDDSEEDIQPEAEETCDDGIDQDCASGDLSCDDVDDDGDGFSENEDDCDDEDEDLNPDEDDTCGDGIDQDCSGTDATCATPEPGDDDEPTPVDETPDVSGDGEETTGCGCTTTRPMARPAGAMALWLLAVGLVSRRRR